MGKVAGVIGWPVKHSLSPKLHGYWLKQYGIDGEYKAQGVEPTDLKDFLKSLPQTGWQGCNLTLPHKEAAFKLVDELDDIARAVGAVNTIIVKDGKLLGRNSDVYGFAENIRPHLRAKNKAVVIGAGGAAYAVVQALLQEGFKKVEVTNRTESRAQVLREHFKNKISVLPWESRHRLEGADLLVNTTSQGMVGQEPLDLKLDALPKEALVTDIVYTPLITPLLAQAKARGNTIVDGLGMLIHQGVPGFEAWFGVRPEVTEQLRRYLLQ